MPSVYQYDNKEYRRDVIEAIIAEQDSGGLPRAVGGGRSSPTSVGLGGGRSSPASVGLPSEAGNSDGLSSEGGGQRCNVIPGGDRKTKHFFSRLCGIP